MAKNPTGSNQKIRLNLEERSQQDLQKFLKTMQNIKSTVDSTDQAFQHVANALKQNSDVLRALKTDAKQFKMIADAMKRNSIMTQGPGDYFAGVEQKTNATVAAVKRLGTAQGQTIDNQKRLLALAQQGAKYVQNEATVQQALNLKLGMHAKTVQKISDLEKARSLVKASELRMNLEIAEGNRKQAKGAERILRLARERVQVLDQEQKKTAALAREQEKRAKRIRNNLRGDREEERSQGVAGRRKSLERITGDSGASLFAIQTNVMANYMAMNAARNTVTEGIDFTVQLDESLRNLQAITVTTDENMGLLREEILEVSEATKFFATNIADATVTLGQAGFSTKEIMNSVSAVALLATATGTELSKSVDLTTSILGVFRMESAQMAEVAHTLTAAVNTSKLNIDKLALGLQYAGNTASQSGVSFEELTATLGAMANAGIRSGSTLGTGMRQILIALQKPSGKFLETLQRLGITMDQINLKSNGLYGVMKNLQEGGFSASDAIGSFEVRAAAAFNALSGNLDQVVELERAFLHSAAAAKANETQMRALANQGRRLQANLGAVISTGLEPLKIALRDSFSGIADMLEGLREYPAALQQVITGFTALIASLLVVRTSMLAINLLGLASQLTTVVTGVKAATTAFGIFTAVVSPLKGILIAAGLAYGAYTLAQSRFSQEMARATDEVEKAQTAYDNAKGRVEELASQMEMATGRIEELSNRSKTLTENQDLLSIEIDKVREQFREMGIDLAENVGSVEELVEALKILRGQLAEKYTLQIGTTENSLALLQTANAEKARTIREGSQIGSRVDARYRRGGRNTREADFFSGFQKSDNSLDELFSMQTEGTALLAAYESAEKKEGGLTGVDNDILDRLRKAKTALDELIALKRTDLGLERQRQELRRQEGIQQNRLDNANIVDQTAEFKRKSYGQFNDSSAGEVLPIRRMEKAQAAQQELRQRGEALKNDIQQDQSLLPEVKEQLVRDIDNTMSEIGKEMGRILEVAKEAAETREELTRIRLDARENGLERELGETSDSSRVDAITAARLGVASSDKNAQLDLLKTELAGKTDSEEFKAKSLAIIEDHKSRVQSIIDQGNTNLARILGVEIDAQELQIAGLQRQLETTADPATRQGIRDQIAAIITETTERKKEQVTYLIDNAEALALEMSKLDDASEETLAQIGEENSEDQQKLAEEDLKAAERALEATLRLADKALENKELAELHIIAAKQLAKIAEKAKALAEVNSEAGEGTEETNLGEAEGLIDQWRDKVFKNNRTNTRRIKGRTGGGGRGKNPYSKKRDEIDQLIDDLKSKLEVAENYLSVGEEVNVEFDNVLENALQKVADISGQIDTLKNKLAAGGGTAAQQKELNNLIDKQARLTTFIRQEEERIALLKLQQGKYAEGIELTAKSWVRENLSISQTIQGGIVSSLGTAKSAMVDFFTSWTDGTKSGKEAFRDMATSIIKSLQNVFAEMLVVYLLQKALGWVNNTFGTSLSIPAAQGAVVEKRGAPRKAAMGDSSVVPGNLNRDSVDYRLMPGESVLTRSATQMIGKDEIRRLNSMGNKAISQTSPDKAPGSQGSTDSTINFYLLDERSQAGSLGPNDVLAVVTDDIARGGNTKKLIKSVQMGHI